MAKEFVQTVRGYAALSNRSVNDVLIQAEAGVLKLRLICPLSTDGEYSMLSDHSGEMEWIGWKRECLNGMPVHAEFVKAIRTEGMVAITKIRGFNDAFWFDFKSEMEPVEIYIDDLYVDGKGVLVKAKIPNSRTLIANERDMVIFKKADELVKKTPEKFSFKSLTPRGEYKINGQRLAEYIYTNQKDLFGGSIIFDGDFDTFKDKIINKKGFKCNHITRLVKKRN